MGMGRDLSGRKAVILVLLLSLVCSFCAAEAGVSGARPLPPGSGHPGRQPAEVEATETGAADTGAPETDDHARPSPAPLASLHLRSSSAVLQIKTPVDPSVSRWRERILEQDRRGVQLALERGRLFRRFIAAEIARRGLPSELIYLPILESHYRVWAVSRSGAVGIWQVMSNTAAPLGLKRDRWVDERRDFWKSTEGALAKLAENHEIFGDWDLALAAYNCGTGALTRTIRASGIRDFWELRRRGLLPPETAAYVPKFHALVSICSDPTAYGLEIDWVPAPLWRRIELRRSVELALLAEQADMPLSLMEEAHAELETPITPPAADRPYYLKIPQQFVQRIEVLLSDPETRLLRFTFHRIRSGDTFYALADYYELSAALLMEANPGVDARRMRIGDQLRIPVFRGREIKSEPELGFADAELSSFTSAYTVVTGDTLWDISKRHDITAEMLAWANGRSLDAVLKPGETLKVPPRSASASSGEIDTSASEQQGETR